MPFADNPSVSLAADSSPCTGEPLRRDEIWCEGGARCAGAGLRLVEEFSAGRRNLFAHAELLEYLVDGFRTGAAAGEGEQGVGCLFQEDGHSVQQFAGI